MIRKGNVCWIVESNRRKRQVAVLKVDRDFATVAFYEGGGIRVHKSRLYPTAAEADRKIRESSLEDIEDEEMPIRPRKKNQYDYMW